MQQLFVVQNCPMDWRTPSSAPSIIVLTKSPHKALKYTRDLLPIDHDKSSRMIETFVDYIQLLFPVSILICLNTFLPINHGLTYSAF